MKIKSRVYQAPLATLIISALGVIVLSLIVRGNTVVRQAEQNIRSEFQYQVGILTESTGTEVLDVIHESFTPLTKSTAKAGFGQINHWYRVTLENQTDAVGHLRLLMDNPIFDSLTLYYFDPRFDDVQVSYFGDARDNISPEQRILPNVAFDLVPGQAASFYLHLQTDGSPILSLTLMSEAGFEQYSRMLHIIWGSFIGIALVLGAYNTVLYVGLRDSVYLYYVGYLMAVLMTMGVIHGYGYYLFSESLQLWFSKQIVPLQSLVALSALMLGKLFLKISPSCGAAYKLANSVATLLILFFLIALFIPESLAAPVFVLLQVATYVSAVLMIRYRFKSRISWTRYYLFSWIPFFIGAGVGMGLFAGLIEYSFLSRHTFIFSVLFELTFISMALADRMSETERKRFFLATHDIKTNLANEFYIEQKIEQLRQRKQASLTALIAIRVTNYDRIVPYLTEPDRRLLLKQLTVQFALQIDQYAKLIPLDELTRTRVSVVNDNTFFYLASVASEAVFETLMNQLSNKDNYNPLQSVIPFRVQCTFSARLLDELTVDSQTLLNSVKEGINNALEHGLPMQIYSEEKETQNARGIKLAQALETAIQQNQLQLYYQPQLCLFDNRACCSEVLLRWIHADMGFIPPMEFIDIAEKTGLIRQLTLWVIEQTFREHGELATLSALPMCTSINISAIDLSRPGFADDVIQLAQKHQVAAERFTLEVTETSHQQDQGIFTQNLIALKEAGFHLAIDDFGTGYSSLTYVSDLPFDELKIDRSFVKDMVSSQRQQQIVQATIDMAIQLGLTVTAEGIEDKETLEALRMANCHKIQGYFYEKPMPFTHFQTWLKTQRLTLTP